MKNTENELDEADRAHAQQCDKLNKLRRKYVEVLAKKSSCQHDLSEFSPLSDFKRATVITSQLIKLCEQEIVRREEVEEAEFECHRLRYETGVKAWLHHKRIELLQYHIQCAIENSEKCALKFEKNENDIEKKWLMKLNDLHKAAEQRFRDLAVDDV